MIFTFNFSHIFSRTVARKRNMIASRWTPVPVVFFVIKSENVNIRKENIFKNFHMVSSHFEETKDWTTRVKERYVSLIAAIYSEWGIWIENLYLRIQALQKAPNVRESQSFAWYFSAGFFLRLVSYSILYLVSHVRGFFLIIWLITDRWC